MEYQEILKNNLLKCGAYVAYDVDSKRISNQIYSIIDSIKNLNDVEDDEYVYRINKVDVEYVMNTIIQYMCDNVVDIDTEQLIDVFVSNIDIINDSIDSDISEIKKTRDVIGIGFMSDVKYISLDVYRALIE